MSDEILSPAETILLFQLGIPLESIAYDTLPSDFWTPVNPNMSEEELRRCLASNCGKYRKAPRDS